MRLLVSEKEEAITLRRKGLSYKEILEKVPVAKSTLSVWLQKMPLTDAEKAILKRRRESNISVGRIRAAASLHDLKVARDNILFETARKEFELNRKDPFFYVGMALYWAEGSKRSDMFTFVNSDSDMVFVMLKWMEKFLGVNRNDVHARLYIHKPYAHENCEHYWSSETGIPLKNFRRTVYKPTNLLVKKRPNYKGCIRIELGAVTYFRRYVFWQKMMLEDYRKQG